MKQDGGHVGKSLGVDGNHDGKQDVFAANDTVANFLNVKIPEKYASRETSNGVRPATLLAGTRFVAGGMKTGKSVVRPVPPASITDGTSNTIAYLERYATASGIQVLLVDCSVRNVNASVVYVCT